MNGTYDAWNRLVSVAGVATYGYDGLNRRVIATAGGQTRHSYYTAQWQDVEERLDGSATPERQFVWGLRYIDDLVLRDRSTTGTLNERLYALQDANWNVTAVVNTSGTVQERYRYSPYGVPTFLNPSFVAIALGGNYQWETLYAGYYWNRDSGSYQVRNRYFQAQLGCWITRDPIGYDSTDMNQYLYCRSQPLSMVDPFGKDCTLTSSTLHGESTEVYAGEVAIGPSVSMGPGMISYYIAEEIKCVKVRKYRNLYNCCCGWLYGNYTIAYWEEEWLITTKNVPIGAGPILTQQLSLPIGTGIWWVDASRVAGASLDLRSLATDADVRSARAICASAVYPASSYVAPSNKPCL